MLKKFSVLMFVLVMAFAAGCGSSTNENSDATGAPKDELVVAIGGEPDGGFDPTTGWGRYGSTLFQSKLFTRDKDLNIVNDLATGCTVSDDGLTYRVDLRKDVKFTDGVPLTAEDVVYTYETTAKSSSAFDLTNLESVKALNDYSVEFTLKAPQSTFFSIMAELGIVPKHAHNSDYAQKPIGSGHYKFVQWDKGQQLIAEANPDYYEEKPFFKKITFLFLNEEAAFAAAKAGQVDIAGIVPAVASQKVEGMRLVPLPSVDNRGIMFPCVKSGSKTKDGYPIGNDVTSDIAIRKAINVAIDRKALVDGVLNGYGSPAYSICDRLPWWNPGTVIKDADMEEARKILADGGWKDNDGDGILEKGGLKAKFTLVYPSGDQVRQSLAIAVSDQIKPLGIEIAVEGKSWDEIKTLMHSNAILFGWGSHDPVEMYHVFSSKYRGVDWYNTGFYSNAKVDEYMDTAMKQKSEAEANEYWKKAQWDGTTGFSAKGDAPWAWLVNLNHLYLVSEKLDIGEQKIHPHGHGWPITDTITSWHWTE